MKLLILAAFTALSYAQQLSPSDAARIISESAAFREPRRIELLIGGRVPANVTRAHYLLFAQAGLVRYSVQNAVAEVSLTDRGKQASKGWTRSYRSSYNGADLWHVVIGERQLIGTPRIVKSDSSSAQVEFEWRWNPNDIGRMLRLSGGPFRSRSALQLKNGRYELVDAQLAAELKTTDASQ